MAESFADNLRLLCSFEPSVSGVCRAVGINRQQFAKYLSGQARPSPYNRQRIAGFFGLAAADLDQEHGAFAQALLARRRLMPRAPRRQDPPLVGAFSGDPQPLRRYLGHYLIHCHSCSWPGHYVRGLARIRERDGHVLSTSIERLRDPQDGTLYRMRYEGQVALLGSQLFIVEHQRRGNDAIVETILDSRPRSALTLLSGLTIGFASRERAPYASRSVWKYLGTAVDLPRVMPLLGLVPVDGGGVERRIAALLGTDALTV